MTREQKRKAVRYISRLLAFQVQPLIYKWDTAELVRESYDDYIKCMKALNIDFSNLTEDDAFILGLAQISSNSKFYAIPIHIACLIPEGITVYNAWDGKPLKMPKYFNDDTSSGYTVYALKVK